MVIQPLKSDRAQPEREAPQQTHTLHLSNSGNRKNDDDDDDDDHEDDDDDDNDEDGNVAAAAAAGGGRRRRKRPRITQIPTHTYPKSCSLNA